MEANPSDTLRVIVFKEADRWGAQCLEYDIAAFADEVATVLRRISAALCAEGDFTHQSSGTRFGGIEPAPRHFLEMYDRVEVHLVPTGDTPKGVEFKLAA